LAALQEYKCPCCGGSIEWNSSLQRLKCPYCDTEFDQATLESFDEDQKNDVEDDMSWQTQAGTGWAAGETDNMRVFTCKSCGGEIIGDKEMAATSCPYCGNSVVVPSQFKGDLRPDFIIPFKTDKKQAKEGLRRHLQGKSLLPRVFKDENHIDEIKGIYVPFWLFDAEAEAVARFKATTTNRWREADANCTETKYFQVTRHGRMQFEHVACDGSSKMDDQMMESIEPFDFKDAVPFNTGYLAGYFADCYDVTAEQSIERANNRIRNSMHSVMQNSVTGYESVQEESCKIRLNNATAKYALYPVWVLNTNWKGKIYPFCMNGQTGKFIGDLPVDESAAGKMFAKVAVGVGLVAFAASYLIWMLM